MRQLPAVTLLVLVTGCFGATSPISDAANDQVGLVYGYFSGDMGVPNVTLYNTQAEVMASWVPGHKPAHRFANGLIVFDNVAPGEYYIHGLGIGQTADSLDRQRLHVTVRPGEIVYLGAFEYTDPPDLFSPESTFTPASDISDSTVLDLAVEATADTDWSERLRRQRRSSPSSVRWIPVGN